MIAGARAREGGIELDLQVVPRSAREGLGPLHGERIKARVNAPPVDGAANEALRALLAGLLGVPRQDVRVTRGLTGRKKTVAIGGDPERLLQRVTALLQQERDE